MKIEKCPFCGKQIAEITNCNDLEECRHFEKCPATEPYVCIVCNMHEGGCGASSEYYDSEAKAIAAWNRRVILDGCENELIVRSSTNCTTTALFQEELVVEKQKESVGKEVK